ncbi:MAG: pilus assembly protein [Bdellovibrionales bacterium]|nr:pilus assembly protein [Bdellovibrionales bacterium]
MSPKVSGTVGLCLSANDRGAALAEAALVLPLLFFLFGAVLDFGRMIQSHAVLSQAVSEATRLAARLEHLEAGAFVGSPHAVPSNNHSSIHRRLAVMLSLQGNSVPLEDLVFQSECRTTDPDDPRKNRTIRVEARGEYYSIFPVLSRIPLWSSHATSYLAGARCVE